MPKLGIFKRLKPDHDPTNEIVMKIQKGDKILKERFISDYTPFILKAAVKTTGKYVDIENSEAYSVALMAFDEAIDCFNSNKNKSFLGFSDLVINRRLIDYIRKNKKDSNVFPFTYFDCESYEEIKEKFMLEYSMGRLDNIEIKEEIIFFKERLATFGITLESLAKSMPKHKDSKRLCIRIAKIIANDSELYYKLNKTKNIPMTDLMKLVDVHQATVERNRKLIIAVSLVINSGLDVIKSYLQFTEEGGWEHD
ncbi:MAG TPA: RNA polymerase sigma-I factor [Pseudobacteroides sp.]|uniref:RNA polymerase sigma-I factor n=1 Tax=Pseudobacteroides sp. TaxID=1968840 RepID=UPI002F926C19